MKSSYNEPLHFNTKSFTINDAAESVMRCDMKVVFLEVFFFVETNGKWGFIIMSDRRLYTLITSHPFLPQCERYSYCKCTNYGRTGTIQ